MKEVKLMILVCIGVLLLVKVGLLEGLKVIIYWVSIEKFKNEF